MKQHIIQPKNTLNKWKRDLHKNDTDTKRETLCSQMLHYSCEIKILLFQIHTKSITL